MLLIQPGLCLSHPGLLGTDLSRLFLPRYHALQERTAEAELQQVPALFSPSREEKNSPVFWFLSPRSIPGAIRLPDWVPRSCASSERSHGCVQTSNACVLNCTFNYIY